MNYLIIFATMTTTCCARMKTVNSIVLMLLLGTSHAVTAATALNYSGSLKTDTGWASGEFQIVFQLYSNSIANDPVSVAITNQVAVSNGVFSSSMDFGIAPFTLDPLWLELSVRKVGVDSEFTILTPRQKLSPLPQAVYSAAAGTITLPVPDELLSSNVARLDQSPVFLSTSAPPFFVASSQVVPSLNSDLLDGLDSSAFAQTGLVEKAFTNTNTLYVDSDGDDSTAIRGRFDRPYRTIPAAVREAHNGDTVLIRPGDYPVTPGFGASVYGAPIGAPIVAFAKTNLSLIGLGWPRITFTNQGDVFAIDTCHNLTLQNISFVGNRFPGASHSTVPANYSTVLLRGTNQELNFLNLRFENIGNHGISHLYGERTSSKVRVFGCRFKNLGATNMPAGSVDLLDGAGISGVGSDWTISLNRFESCARGVELEKVSFLLPITNVRISENTFVNGEEKDVILFSGAIGDIQNVVIENNQFSGGRPTAAPAYGYNAIYCDGGTEIHVVNNHLSNLDGNGIVFVGGHLTVDNSQISGNRLSKITSCAIQVYELPANTGSVSNCVISGNYIREAGDLRGAILISGQGIEILRNEIIDSTGPAIHLVNDASSGTRDIFLRNNSFLRRIQTPSTRPAVAIDQGVTQTRLEENSYRGFTITLDDGGSGTIVGENFYGSGSPEGNVSAPKGSVYRRLDGSDSIFYFKRTGNGNTGWSEE